MISCLLLPGGLFFFWLGFRFDFLSRWLSWRARAARISSREWDFELTAAGERAFNEELVLGLGEELVLGLGGPGGFLGGLARELGAGPGGVRGPGVLFSILFEGPGGPKGGPGTLLGMPGCPVGGPGALLGRLGGPVGGPGAHLGGPPAKEGLTQGSIFWGPGGLGGFSCGSTLFVCTSCLLAGIGACLSACCDKDGPGWGGRSFGCMQAWESGNLARGGNLANGLVAFTFDGAAAGFKIEPLAGPSGAKAGAFLARGGAAGLFVAPVLLDTATPLNFIRDCFAFSWASFWASAGLDGIGGAFPVMGCGGSLDCFGFAEFASDFKVWFSPV